MFELSKHGSKIAHLNVRTEKHGEEDVLAVDVTVASDVTNDFLSYLNPTLKWSLYAKPDSGQGDLIQDDAHLPRLRYAELSELRWVGTMPKAAFIIHGKKKSDDLALEGDVGKLVLTCKEGGTVSIAFKVAVLPTPEQLGALSALLGTEAKVSVREADAADPEAGDAKS